MAGSKDRPVAIVYILYTDEKEKEGPSCAKGTGERKRWAEKKMMPVSTLLAMLAV